MITITRHLARRVRAVFRKALKITRGVGPPIVFQAGEDGLRIQAQNTDVAVEYHEAGSFPTESLRLPLEFLNDFTGGRDGPVELEQAGKKHVEVRWTENSVPKAIRYETPNDAPGFPPRPERMVEQSRHFVSALKDASETSDPGAVRMALGCLELCEETGEIAATDAHQLLVQRGFAFTWNDKVLIPASPIWGCSELAESGPVSVGRTDEAVVVMVGAWSLWLKVVKDVRFPRVRDHIPTPEMVRTSIDLTEEDAQFLADHIKGLPSGERGSQPVTLDLNGEVIVRGQAENQLPRDLVLSNSKAQGPNLRVNTNRQFLLRATRLGFRQLRFTDSESPVFCQDERRSFVWAVLEKDGAIPPNSKSLRVESPRINTPSIKEAKKPQMPESRKPNKPPDRNGHTPKEPCEVGSLETLVEQAESLQETLREAAAKLRGLMAMFKQHRKESKSVQTCSRRCGNCQVCTFRTCLPKAIPHARWLFGSPINAYGPDFGRGHRPAFV